MTGLSKKPIAGNVIKMRFDLNQQCVKIVIMQDEDRIG